jgi:hypothetical protein
VKGGDCTSCVFFSANTMQPGVGQCRRHAPILVMTERGVRTQWPMTNERNWCGDYASTEDEVQP